MGMTAEVLSGHADEFDAIIEEIGLQPEAIWEKLKGNLSSATQDALAIADYNDEDLEDGAVLNRCFARDAVQVVQSYLQDEEKFNKLLGGIMSMVGRTLAVLVWTHKTTQPLAGGKIEVAATDYHRKDDCILLIAYPGGLSIWDESGNGPYFGEVEPDMERAISVVSVYAQTVFLAAIRAIANVIKG